MSVIPYRRDIDGLRAIAVLLVVFSHAQINLFQGGFVGVDIFFIISGYLITSIMVNEVDSQKFSFKQFYLRRVKRIFPALVAVMTVTTLAAHKILMPRELFNYAKAQFAALVSFSNVFLWKFYGGYWRGSSKEFPLTHTWSLSVEEQFYAIWPIIFLSAYTFIPKKYHTRILILAFTLLLPLSQYLEQYPEFAFYMIPARFYELFMGAMAALIVRKPIKISFFAEKHLITIIHLVGVILILYASLFFKEGLPYPGFNAFIPCLGALLLIVPFERQESPVSGILSSRPLVGIGKISYSLYLWHWPIFSLIAYTGHSVKDYRISALLASFGLSIVSYYLVEQPCRRMKISLGKAAVVFVLVPVILGGFYLYGAGDGYIDRYNGVEKKAVKAISQPEFPFLRAQLGKGSPTDTHIEDDETIWGYDKKGPITALLVGDSHSTAIRPFVEVLCQPLGIKGLQVSRDSTPFLLNVDFYDPNVYGEDILRIDKRKMNDYWKQLSSGDDIKYVFIAAFYSSRIFPKGNFSEKMIHDSLESGADVIDTNKESFYRGLRDTVKYLVEHGKVPVLFNDIPYIKSSLSRNYAKNLLFSTTLPTTLSWDEIVKRHEFEDKTLNKIKEEFPSVILIDIKKLLKDYTTDGIFQPVINDVPLYLDSNHLSSDGAYLLGSIWLEKFGIPFADKN